MRENQGYRQQGVRDVLVTFVLLLRNLLHGTAYIGVGSVAGHIEATKEGHGALHVVVDRSSTSGARVVEAVTLLVILLAILSGGVTVLE